MAAVKRTVVVTGGTQGIGAFIAAEFARLGDRVLVTGRTQPKRLPEHQAGEVRFCLADVRERDSHARVAQEALQWGGRLDVWINNAGVSIWKPLAEVDREFWDLLMDTNARGTYFGCQAASGVMGSGGVIININSLAGKRGSSNNSVYCASKFAVTGITQALAKELGPRGIRVNAVCPVYIETDSLKESLQKQESPAGSQPVSEYLSGFARGNSALLRLPTGAEVARTCVFLASDASSAITGQNINVDCGVLPQ